jgi:hypothetical protein
MIKVMMPQIKPSGGGKPTNSGAGSRTIATLPRIPKSYLSQLLPPVAEREVCPKKRPKNSYLNRIS